jgi:hypothetical protein
MYFELANQRLQPLHTRRRKLSHPIECSGRSPAKGKRKGLIQKKARRAPTISATPDSTAISAGATINKPCHEHSSRFRREKIIPRGRPLQQRLPPKAPPERRPDPRRHIPHSHRAVQGARSCQQPAVRAPFHSCERRPGLALEEGHARLERLALAGGGAAPPGGGGGEGGDVDRGGEGPETDARPADEGRENVFRREGWVFLVRKCGYGCWNCRGEVRNSRLPCWQ